MCKRIKFTTRDAALKDGTLLNELAKGVKRLDDDIFDKIMSIASIIKTFTKNVEIAVSDENCGLLHGEAWFFMKNTNEEERFNNATAYKVLVNLIDPSIKVGSSFWPDGRDDVIDVNFFGYTYNVVNNGGQAENEEQAKREEHAREEGRKLARSEGELFLNEAFERLHKKVMAEEKADNE